MSKLRTAARRAATAAGCGTLALVGGTVAWLETSPARAPAPLVQDVTQLIRIEPERIVTPTDAAQLQALIAAHRGPISIGGGRFSMGGQIGTDGTLFLDMRALNRVVDLDVDARTVTVQAGATWRDVIQAIDPHDLSVKIMQSYANFTVGGSVSVNAHGRYVGEGPLADSVRALELVLADGRLVRCNRDEHPELFWGAVGGYGALGVIATVTLALTDNVPLERRVERMPVAQFRDYFERAVRADPDAVMFNADLYPPDYDDVVAITFARTDRPPTVPDRLQAPGGSTAAEKLMYWYVADGPLGKQARRDVVDSLRLQSQPVVWRNHEATYDVASLDPFTRRFKTHILQEYFVPVDRLDDFVPRMRRVFQAHDVNVLNVSIRHASAEPDSLLTWAPTEVFAFVVYHQMRTTPDAWQHAQTWTREMLDEVLEVGGTWYLPYQIHATPAQLHRGYPRAHELFALKRRVDPGYTFRSRLFDAYLPPDAAYGGVFDRDALRARLQARPTWARPEDQTFLTLPEWSIVYAADETGAFLADHRPSAFPWLGSVRQFWTTYRTVWGRTRDGYAFNTGYHAMIAVIGVSFTVEYGIKGLYEGTLGWLLEGERVPEEDVYAQVMAEYGAFTHHTPWYAFPFDEARARVLSAGGGGLRGFERRVVLGAELTLKGWWAAALAGATGAAYAPEAETLEVWALGEPADVAGIDGVRVLEQLAPGHLLLSLPRYEPFTAAATALAARGVGLVEIAGGRRIVVQVLAPATWDEAPLWAHTLTPLPLLTDPDRSRWALEVPVERLDQVLPALQASGATVEHLYDF